MRNVASPAQPASQKLATIAAAPRRGLWLGLVAIVVAGAPLAVTACGSQADDTCTCLADNNGERRTLACGQTQCVGGLTISCVDKDKLQTAGACTTTPGTPEGPTGPFDSGAPPDTSCADLQSFCDAQCTTPPQVASDCESTANAGDPDACRSWQSANQLLCKG